MDHINNKKIIRCLVNNAGKMVVLIALLMFFNRSAIGQASLVTYTTNLAGVQSDDTYNSVSITTTFSGGAGGTGGIKIGSTTYTSMYIGSNGYITFGTGYRSYNPTGIAGFRVCPMVAAQFDDLYPGKGGHGYVYYSQYPTYLVVTYIDIPPYNTPTLGSGYNTFQIILRKGDGYDGNSNLNFQIEIRYNNMQWGRAGTAGAYPTGGWTTGTGTTYGEVQHSGTSGFLSVVNTTNCNTTGVYQWNVTGGVVKSVPTVNSTTSVSSISGSGGSSGGNVSADGGESVTDRGVVYSTSQNPTYENSSHVSSSTPAGTGTFTATMTGLNPGTTYYVRAYATNSLGTGYGPQVSFTTSSISTPTVSTTAVSSITTSSASSGYTVTSTGGATVTAQGIVWNTGGSPTTSSYTGTSTGALSGLSPNTTYYVRAYATNSAGTGYGSQVSFTTYPTDPTDPVASSSTICNGEGPQLSVSNAQGTVYWYSGSCGGTYIGTGNPITVYPGTTTTYYAKNYNTTGYSSGCTSGLTITVNQPASQPASASVTVPSGTDGLTTANLSWSESTGLTPITYYWAVGTSSGVTYESGYTVNGTTTDLSAVATGLTKSTTYYLSVKAFNGCGASVYRTSSSFRTNHTLDYIAGENGSISGTASQVVANGADGTQVEAVPNTGYNFVNWSDGSVVNPRTHTGVTNSISVTASFAPNRLAFGTQPTTQIAGANIPVTVCITDTYGNTMTNSTAAVTIAISNNPSTDGAGTLHGTTTVSAVAGVATFSDLWIDKTGAGYTLIVSADAPIVTAPVSNSFTINPAAIDHFTVEGITDPVVAGTTTSPVVTAYDQYDNIKTDYTGTITLSSPDTHRNDEVFPTYTYQSSDQGTVTLVNQLTLKTTGERSVVATGDGKTGTQSDITVTPAAIHYFILAANPDAEGNQQSVTAGVEFSVKATVYDEYDNIKTNYEGAHDVIWTTAATPSRSGMVRIIPNNGEQTFTAGVATISGFTLYNAHETPTITITDGPSASPGTTAAITVKNTILDNFLVESLDNETGETSTTQRATVPFDIRVTARDVYYNTCLDYTGSIRFKSSDDALITFPSGLQPFSSSDQGIRTFTDGITIGKTGAYWVRAADSQYAYKQGSQRDIMVQPGPFTPNESDFTVDATTKIAGQNVVVTLTPRDTDGNLLIACQNISVSLDGNANAGIQQNNGATEGSEGIYVFYVQVTSTTAPNVITAKLGETAFNGSYTITVNPAPPSLAHTTITATSGSITTNENTLVTVQLYDQYNNLRTTDDGVVTLNTVLGAFNSNSGTPSVSAVYAGSGNYTATLYANYDASTNGVGIAAITGSIDFNETEGPGVWSGDPWPADGAITDGESVTITEGLPDLITSTITATPTEITTDGSSAVTVQLKDFLGNLITHDRGTVTLTTDLGLLNNNSDQSATVVADYTSGGKYEATLTANYTASDALQANGVGTATITGSFTGTEAASSVSGSFDDNDTEVTITEGLPDVADIEITSADQTITADESTVITVQLKDQFGNLIVNDRGTVALSVSPIGVIDNGSDSPAASAITAIYTSDGKYSATFKLAGIGVGDATITGTFRLSGSETVSAISDNAVVAVTPGVATHLAIDTQPSDLTQAVAGVDFTPQPVIHILDQWNNLVTYDNSSVVTAAIGSVGTSTLESTGSLTATAVGGIAAFSGLNYKKAETININFTSDPLLPVTSGNFYVKNNVENYFAITGNSEQTAGTSQTITITAYDTYGNQALDYTGDKSLTFSGAETSPTPGTNPETTDKSGTAIDFGTSTTITFTEGVATSIMTLYNDEEASISATDNNINATGHELAVDVSYTSSAYLGISGNSTQVAGVAQTITVKAYDSYNNVNQGYSGTKTLHFAGANGSPSPSTNPTVNDVEFGSDVQLVFTNGQATATMKLYNVEDAVITVTDQDEGGPMTRDSEPDSRLHVTVNHAPANYFAVTGTESTQVAGTSQTITVTAYDQYNNQATGYTGDKNIVFSGASVSDAYGTHSATSPTVESVAFGATLTLNFTSGAATGSMYLYKVETASVVATAGSITTPAGYLKNVTVTPSTATYLAVTGTGSQTAGTSQDITITAYDAYNNVATDYTGGTLTFTGADPSPAPATNPTVNDVILGLSTAPTFTSGAVTVAMKLYKVQTAQITVTDGEINANSDKLEVAVSHADPYYLAITGSGTQTAGTTNNITLRAYDQYNNLATGYDGSKSITFGGANSSPSYDPDPAYAPTVSTTAFGTSASVTFSAGVAQDLPMILYKEENALVTATDANEGVSGITTPNNVTADETTYTYKLPVVVSQSAPAYLAITGNPQQTAGIAQTITITAYDAYNNTATNYTGSHSLIFDGANASPDPVTYPTVAGTIMESATSLTFSSGVATANMILYKTENAVITVADNTNSIDEGNHSLPVLVLPTVLKDFVVDNISDPHDLGVRVSPRVEARDTYGNRKTNYAGTVTFSNTDIYAINPDDYQFTTEDHGIHTFPDGVLFSQPGEDWWLTALDYDDPRKYGYQSEITVQRAVTVTANNQSKTYGQGPENAGGDYFALGTTEFTVTGTDYVDVYGQTVSPVVAGEITNVVLTSDGETKTAGIGSYAIVPGSASFASGVDGGLYHITYNETGSLTVNKRDLTLNSFLADNKTYDGTTTVTGAGFSDDRVNSDELTFSYTAAFADRTAAAGKTVNYTDIAISGGAGSGNYTLITTSGTATADISVRNINVTAQTDTKIYDGSTASSVLPVVETLQTGDVLTSVGIQTFDTELAGTGKTLIPSGTVIDDGNNGDNYSIHYLTDVTGVIEQRPIAITVDTSQQKIYGEDDPVSYTYTVTSGSLAEGDTFDGALERISGNNVGYYGIGQGTLTMKESGIDKQSSYAVTYEPANFEIIARPITLTANNQNKTYGEAPDLGTTAYTLTDGTLASGETVDNVLLASDGAAATASAGTYSIAISNATGTNFTASNYAINYVAGTLTVDKKELLVNANSGQTKVYGEDDPAFTYSYSGFENTDDAGLFTGALTRESGIHVGTDYEIQLGTLSAGDNYTITYTPADFSITVKPVTVTVTSGQQKTYGDSDPVAFTYSADVPLAYSDVFSGALSRVSGEDVATDYTIERNTLTIVDGEGTNVVSDYNITYAGATFAINPLAVSVSADAQTKTYGESDPVLTYVSVPAVGTELANGEVIGFTGTLSRVAGETVAGSSYAINQGTLANSNYTITYTGAQLIINKLDITGNFTVDATKVYDQTTSANVLTRTLNGVISPDEVILSEGTASYSDKNVGTGKTVTLTGYSLTGADAGNYNLTGVATTTAGITQKYLHLSNFGADSKYYDGTTVATGIGFNDDRINGDNLAFGRTAAFENASVGNSKNVNYTDISISGGLDKNNYILATTTGVAIADIWAKPLIVTITGIDKEYDGTTNATVSLSAGFVEGDDVALTYTSAVFDDVTIGEGKTVTVTGISLTGEKAGQYSLVSTSGTTTASITQKTLTVSGSFTVADKTYDGTTNATIETNNLTLNGIVNTENVTLTPEAAFTSVGRGNNKTVILTASTALGGTDAGNYTLSLAGAPTATANITGKAIHVINAVAQNRDYDGTNSVTISGAELNTADLETGATDVSLANASTGTLVSSNVGSNLSVTTGMTISGNDADNYTLIQPALTVNITKRSIAVTADSKSKIYGENDPALTYLVTAGSLAVGQSFSGSLQRVSGDNTGAYAINAGTLKIVDGTDADVTANYTVNYNPADLTISKKDASVTPIASGKTYGGSDPSLTGTLNGFLTGDNVTAVYSRTSGESVGSSPYAISAVLSPSGVLGNYNITYNTADFTISKKDASVTPIASGKTYGGSDPVLTGTLNGFLTGDNVTAVYSRTSGESVGSSPYTISAVLSPSGVLGNYNITYNTADFTISKKDASVTPIASGKTYGGSDPVLTGTLSGFLAEDNVTAVYSRTSGESVGSSPYTISAALSPSGVLGNYNITYNTAFFDINSATLTVTAHNDSKDYDGSAYSGGNGVIYEGFVNGETSSSLEGTLTYSGTSQGAVNKGTYAITPGGLTSANYSIMFVNGELTISKARLTITANDDTKTYDGNAYANGNGVTYSGFLGADNSGSLSGTLSYTGSSQGAVNKGEYVITAGGLTSENYDITWMNGRLTVNSAPVHVDGAVAGNKIYDGTTGATISGATLRSTEVFGDDDVSLVNSTSGTFTQASAGNGIAVTANMSLDGSDKDNYTLIQPGGLSANITAKSLTITGTFTAEGKTYNGTTAATIATNSLELAGIVGSENVSLNAVATFDTPDAGTGKTVSLTDSGLAGTDAGNYTLSFEGAPVTNAGITTKELTLSGGFTAISREYNGTTAASINNVTLQLVGLVAGDDVTLTAIAVFPDANAGTGKTVSLGSSVISGTDAANYTLSFDSAPAATANITVKQLTVSNAVAQNKVYDGTNTASISGASLDGTISGDNVSLDALTGQFARVSVGTNISVSSTLTLQGTSKNNYTLVQPVGLAADITAKELTVTGTVVAGKTYDGTTNATITGANLAGTVSNDDVALGTMTGSFAQSTVGNDIPVTVSLTLSGTAASNYSLTQPTGLTADITAKELTVIGAVASDKVYDGTTDAVITGADLSGVISGDEVILAGGETGTFAQADIGNNIAVTTSMTLSGADAGNYYLTQPAGLTADILNGTQVISLSAGWNIISFDVVPSNPDLLSIFQPLTDSGTLLKVMNESGTSIENFGSVLGWQNSIGNNSSTEGYKVKVSTSTTLTVSGTPVSLPIDIPLTTGWNIISFPTTSSQNALSVLQTLIDQGYLIKAMDESGHSVEYFGSFLGWQNSIGEFSPNKGYKIRVSTNCTLTISNSMNSESYAFIPQVSVSTHFKSIFSGNGVDHMNVNLLDLASSGFISGDEIGIFDGTNCVGSATVETDNLTLGVMSIPVSADDGMSQKVNGFVQGNVLTMKLYRNGQEFNLPYEPVNQSSGVFGKGSSLWANATVEVALAVDTNISENTTEMKCFPNPFAEELSIEVNAPAGVSLNIEVYDISGRKVADVYRGTSTGNNLIKWDGTNGRRQIVSPGIYYIRCNKTIVSKIIKK